jgi:Secretion system C-terminal sorting domain
MKNYFLFIFSMLFVNLIVAQQSVVITGPLSVEVGVPYNYTFTFNPVYPSSTDGVKADSYIITGWTILTGINGSSSDILGYIGTPSNTSSYFNDSTYNSANPKTIPIQWGNNNLTTTSTDYVTVKVSGIYRKSSTGENIGYFNFLTNTLQPISVGRLFNPIINGATSITDCDQTNQTYSYSNDTNDNQRLWTVTNGGTIVGSATGKSIVVKPPLSGNFAVLCTIKRAGGSPTYSLTASKNISRNSRNVSFIGDYLGTNAPFDFACKVTGRKMTMTAQSGISTINWVAPNCTIIGQNTLTPIITPLSTATTGSFVNVYADVVFSGGCLATTATKSFQVLDATAPQIPQGTITFTPQSGNICSPGYWVVKFKPSTSSPFNNGEIFVDPATIIPRNGSTGPYLFDVCYINLCTGVQSCKTFSKGLPTPCTTAKISSDNTSTKLAIVPNPTNGNFILTLSEKLSGNYQIFDSKNSNLIQEDKFDNQTELQINLSPKLKPGIYILKVITASNIFTEKIILTK